jgi:hypothetical protein
VRPPERRERIRLRCERVTPRVELQDASCTEFVCREASTTSKKLKMNGYLARGKQADDASVPRQVGANAPIDMSEGKDLEKLIPLR